MPADIPVHVVPGSSKRLEWKLRSWSDTLLSEIRFSWHSIVQTWLIVKVSRPQEPCKSEPLCDSLLSRQAKPGVCSGRQPGRNTVRSLFLQPILQAACRHLTASNGSLDPVLTWALKVVLARELFCSGPADNAEDRQSIPIMSNNLLHGSSKPFPAVLPFIQSPINI